MKKNVTFRGREGFTLIEVLVTLILLAVLAAAVFPVVTRQADSAEPVRVASDLAAIRNAVESFRLDLRPNWPGDLEDLAHQPTGASVTDPDLNRDSVVHETKWKGPYLDADIAENVTEIATDSVLTTGFDGQIQNDLVCLSAGTTKVDLSSLNCAEGHSVAVQIDAIDAAAAEKLELTIDSKSSTNTTGKFRYDSVNDIGYYVVGPYF